MVAYMIGSENTKENLTAFLHLYYEGIVEIIGEREF